MVVDIAEVRAADAVRRQELRRSWSRARAHHASGPVGTALARLMGRTRG